jgi:serine/threonine-protein kinase HipA
MQSNIHIFIRQANGERSVVGRLLYEQMANGDIQSYFRYESIWLSAFGAFPLDPINLPLQPEVFQLKSRSGLWGVFEDALPDAWGRRLLQSRHQIDVSSRNNIEMLLLTAWAEPGATGFSQTDHMPDHLVIPMDMTMTEEAISTSRKFEKNAEAGSLPDFFISGGSSAGGARPKVLARSGSDLYLVKFPSINDPAPDIMAHLEIFGMSCITNAKIPVPDFFLITTASNTVALAIQRFDTDGGDDRHHFLSFQSLIGIEEQLGLPYSTMAEVIKKVSVDPTQDLQNLYKQMVINILICNRDDHLKNFSMIYSAQSAGFRLSPAYDVVPNLWQREHILSVAGKTEAIDYADLLLEGELFSLTGQCCHGLILEAVRGVDKALVDNFEILHTLSSSHPLCRRLLGSIRGNLGGINASIGEKRL